MPHARDFKPRLRPLEADVFEQDGQQWIALHDPTGMAPGQIAVLPHAFFVIRLFDGEHTIAEVQTAFARHFGQALKAEKVTGLVAQLDEALLLDSPHFAAEYHARVKAYLEGNVRPFHPDMTVSKDEYGGVIQPMIEPIRPARSPKRRAHLAGLIAPHLDYERGRPCYTRAYGTLAGAVAATETPSLVVILGTNHYGMKAHPVGTDKDYETPFGRVAAARDVIGQLSDAYGDNLLSGQYDHLREHSIELQVTILARLLGADKFRMAGFLLPDVCDPTCQANLDNLARGLSELAVRQDGSMLIVAGADLSHIGSDFGDDRRIEPAWLQEISASDRSVIEHLHAGRPESFVDALRATDNATRICSTGSLYVLRRVLADATWEDLGYHQAADADSGICVTCMAAALWQ
jgi:MEMO1 family protein